MQQVAEKEIISIMIAQLMAVTGVPKEIISIMIAQLMAVTGVPNYRDLLFAKQTLLCTDHLAGSTTD